MPDGTVGHVRVAAVPRRPCRRCGKPSRDLDCDGPATPEQMKRRRDKFNLTCNARLCEGCAVRVDGKDLCPRCAGERNLGAGEVTAGETAKTEEQSSMSYQHMVVVGNLGKDPEIRYGQSGGAIGKFSVAVSERVKDGDNWKDHTEWFNVVCFGKTAENAGQYLAKGRKVLVEGRIRQRTYQKNDGSAGYSTELLADKVVFLSPKNEGAPATRPQQKPQQPQQQQQETPPDFDDDLPF
jgi:single-strand DNA-binding protein